MKDTIITSDELSRLIQSTESESTVHQHFSSVNAWTINLHEDVYNWLVDSSSAVDQRKRSLYILTLKSLCMKGIEEQYIFTKLKSKYL